MHIVIDCRFVRHSGIGRYVREIVPRLLRHMSREKFTLLVSRGEWDEVFVQQCKAAHAFFCHVEAGMYSLREQWEIPLRIPRCDVFWAPHYNAPLLPLRARRKIVTIHDMAHLALQDGMSLPKRLYARLFFWNAAHRYDRVFTDSEFSCREILHYEDIAREKVDVHYIAADTDSYRPCGDEERKREVRRLYALPEDYFLFVGNVKPNKNLRRMLEAYAIFRREGGHASLAIVGKKEGLMTGEAGMEEHVRSLGIGDHVLFTGFVADEHLPVIYSAARAFVFPSLYEGFGLPPLEAMACGCPTIVSRAASLPEVCGDAALYVDPHDSRDIAGRLREITDCPQTAQKLVERGFHQVRRFSWEDTVRGIAAVLEELRH